MNPPDHQCPYQVTLSPRQADGLDWLQELLSRILKSDESTEDTKESTRAALEALQQVFAFCNGIHDLAHMQADKLDQVLIELAKRNRNPKAANVQA